MTPLNKGPNSMLRSSSTQKTTYRHTMAYLYDRLPQYRKLGTSALRKGLANIRALCTAHKNPQQRYPIVHIAGTNGKGSTAYTLAALLSQAGYRTGLYTSPHLAHFGERIQVNLKPMCEEAIIAYIEAHKPLIQKILPSFFEISCAMALQYFAKQCVDIAIIETGLGGRWDSTNIVQPICCLITNISYDHCEVLGETYAKIAYEKAGIMKINIPTLLGPMQPEALAVIKKEATKKQVLPTNSTHYVVQSQEETLHHRIVNIYLHNKLHYKELKLGMTADHYLSNLPLILTAADKLAELGFAYNEQQLRKILCTLSIRGRFQLLAKTPITRCDVAHNAAGLHSLFKQVQRLYANKTWHIIFGLSKEKDVQNIVEQLPKQACYYVTQAQVPRAYPAIPLAHAMRTAGCIANSYPTLPQAWEAAQQAIKQTDFLLICGSVYLVGEISPQLMAAQPRPRPYTQQE